MPVAADIVIPTFNGWPLTESCLRHLRRQTVPARVIVVDNGSTDGTPERVRESFPEVEVHVAGANRGYGAACNTGIAAGSAPVVILLNNDVDVEPEFVSRLVAPFDRDARLGSIVPLLLNPATGAIDNVGLCVDPTLAGFPRHQGLAVDHAAKTAPALLGPSGAAAAYRRAALDGAGGFDERIFLYSEDLDLALRVRAAGWTTATALDAVGFHRGSATAGRRSAWQRRHAGFSRGYLVGRYGRAWRLRTLVTESVVVAGDALMSRDLAALRGRIAGLRAARGLPRLTVPRDAVDDEIDFRRSLRLRRADYAVAAS